MPEAEAQVVDYKSEVKPTWCPGCGDFGVLRGVYEAFEALRIESKDVVLVSGIGCSSRIPFFVNSYGFHGVHGRVLPLATGIKIASPNLTVIGLGGDGDGFSIGAGHLPHAMRRNPDLTYIIMDNQIYGLTKGQTSPTSHNQFITKTTPYGNLEDPINPVAFSILYGATFVAKGFSGKARELAELFAQAINHKGFSFVDVLSPCPTFNKVDTFKYFAERLAPVPEEHDPTDRMKALELAYREDKVHIGVYYKVDKPTMQERLETVQTKVHTDTEAELQSLLRKFG